MATEDQNIRYESADPHLPIDTVSEPRQIRYDNENEGYYPILGLLGQKWTTSIILSLSNGPLGFNQIQRLVGLGSATLTSRLRELEQEGLIQKETISLIPPKVMYSLTEKGQGLTSIISNLRAWIDQQSKAVIVAEPRVASDYAESHVDENGTT